MSEIFTLYIFLLVILTVYSSFSFYTYPFSITCLYIIFIYFPFVIKNKRVIWTFQIRYFIRFFNKILSNIKNKKKKSKKHFSIELAKFAQKFICLFPFIYFFSSFFFFLKSFYMVYMRIWNIRKKKNLPCFYKIWPIKNNCFR